MNLIFSPAISAALAIDLGTMGSLGAGWFDAVFKGTVVLALAALALPAMKRCSAATRHLVLLLVMGAVIVLPVFSILLPRMGVLPSWMKMDASAIRVAVESNTDVQVGAGMVKRSQVAARELSPSEDAESGLHTAAVRDSERVRARYAVREERPRWTLLHWGLIAWLAGVAIVLLPAAAGLLSLWHLRRRAQALDPALTRRLRRQVPEGAGLGRTVEFLASSNRRMPMTWGVIRPKLLLPLEALEWPEERQRIVLLHEWAHIQRCDFLGTLLTRLACALHWFNPLVWMLARQMGRDQEQACDDLVLSGGTQPALYAEEVLHIAAGRLPGDLAAFGGLAMARPSTLEGRLLAILDSARDRTSPTRVRVIVACAIAAVAIVPFSMLDAAQISASAASASAGTSEPGLVAWWRGEGNGKDSAGHHDGAFPFGVRFAHGIVGDAFDFRRSHAIEHQLQRVSIPDGPDFQLSDSMTIEAWIFPRRFGGVALIRGDDRGGLDTWQIDLTIPGSISFVFNSADNQGTAVQAPIQLNQWQHIAATFHEGDMRLYVNGILGGKLQTDLRPIKVLDARFGAALGIGNTGGEYYSLPFDGLIDEVRVYNRALSEDEVDAALRR